MNDGLLLGLDVGTTNCKAALFDLHGRLRGLGRVPTPVRHPRPNWAEHDPGDLWRAVVAAVRAALAQAGPAPLLGVAVASMAEAGLLLDRAGRPVSPLIAWYDGRVEAQQRWWAAHIPADETYRATGLLPKPIFGALKLLWLRDNAPDAYAAATRWLHAADYIAFRLCGAQATDYSLAGRTLLFDLAARRWSAALIARAGLRADLLPEPLPAGTRLGAVTPEAAAETGIPAGTPVALGGHDHVCGALAAGVRVPGECLDSMGTAEPVFLPLDTPRPGPAAAAVGISFGAHVAGGRFFAMRGVYSSGAAVEWAARLLALPPAADRYAAFEAAAAQAPPGSLGVSFLPRLTAGARGAFIGLTGAAGAAELARAVYEGVACEWRRLLEAMEATLDTRAATIRVIGGGARSALWLQIKADVLNRPLDVLAIDESTALGAALLAGLGAGVYRTETEAIAAARPAGRRIAPDTERAAFYARHYREAYLPLAGE
jgi:xylulokinase